MKTVIGLEDGSVLDSFDGFLPISKGDWVLDKKGIVRTVLYKKYNIEFRALCLIVK